MRDFKIAEDWRTYPWEWNLRRYSFLVKNVERGYELSIYEYVNDLYYRNKLQEKLDEGFIPSKESLDTLNEFDERLRSLLIPTTGSIHGSYPAHYFWFYGVPKNADDVVIQARGMGVLPIQ